MGWTERFSKTCGDCGGLGGWSHRSRLTGEQVISRCCRCGGHGEIQWGADPGPQGEEGPDTDREARWLS